MILDILNTLASDSGRNFKIDHLKAHASNDTLKQAVFLALDPFTQFFIRKIPEYERAQGRMDDHISLDTAMLMLNKLSTRELTGHAGIAHLTSILTRCSADDAEVIERIIEKDLKCGVSDSTANKAWPKLIHEYPCMLASAFEQKLVDKIKFPAIAQLKMDGMRFNAIVKGSTCEFRSRNGKLIDIPNESFQHPFVAMAAHYKTDMVFDGELLVVDITGKPLDRKTGNGILNKAVKGTMEEEESQSIRATLWDAIPIENFATGKFEEHYSIRLAKLSNAISDMVQSIPQWKHLVALVKHTQVDTPEMAQKVFLNYLYDGQEGIILKDRFGIWEDKRAKHQVKYKGEFECDLICVGWDEGTGKNVGRLGALQLESSCGMLKVGVGSGFNDKDRDEIGKDVIGKIVAVKYNAVVDDKRKDTKSLFLPIFLEIRQDKTTADALSDLL
jgi:ATP-dependent DNA ligase